jgi:hypothetical protein
LNLNISGVFLNENNAGFANLLNIILMDSRVKKRANSIFGMAPRPAYRREARKEGYEERSLSRLFF